MNDILEILANDARVTPEEISKMTGKPLDDVRAAIAGFEKDGTIVKYKTVLDPERVTEGPPVVRALIEVSVSPQKDVGFDQIAERIYQFSEVSSCYLVSGTYDLLVIVEGDNIQTVANFISSKLSPLQGVRGTATHFLLKKYKEDGHIFKKGPDQRRLNISY